MIDAFVKADSLSCLFHRDIASEVLPEPFRMQRDVSFHVTYSEYFSYIISLPSDSPIILSAPLQLLKELALVGNPELLRYYYLDMAFAQAKEVFFAEFFGKDASCIVPTSFNDNNIQLSSMLLAYQHYSNYYTELMRNLKASGYTFTKNVNGYNANLLKIAVILIGWSRSNKVMDEVNLICDL